MDESLSKTIPVKPKQALVTRQKVPEDEMPQISSLVLPYSIITNLRDKMANITFGQLLQIVPSLHIKLNQSLQRKTGPP